MRSRSPTRGRPVGLVDVSVRKTELQAAVALSSLLMVGLGVLILALVAIITMIAARLVLAPLRRMKLRCSTPPPAISTSAFRTSAATSSATCSTPSTCLPPRCSRAQAPLAINLDATMIAPAPANDDQRDAAVQAGGAA